MTIKSCLKQYDNTFKIELSSGEVFYSSRPYTIGIKVLVTRFMGMIRVEST